jgi:Flp pilus assembly protein TadD
MLLKTGATDEAERTFRQALELVPGYHPALAGLGRVQAARGKVQEAIRLLLLAQGKVPLPEYAGLLAKLYRRSGNAELAQAQIALLDLADKLDQAAGESANRTLSLAYSDLGHRVERALDLARAELTVRQDVYTQDALAWALFRNGKLNDAAEAIGKALSQNSPEPAFHEHAAAIFEGLHHEEAAQRHRSLARPGHWD